MKSKCCNTEIVKTGFRKFGESQRYKCLKCHKEIMPKKFLGLFTLLVLSLSLLLLLPSVFALSTTGTVDWNSNVGQIRSDFYGATTGGRYFNLGAGIDNNTISWYKSVWENASLSYDRFDMNLNSYYSNNSDGQVNFTDYSTLNMSMIQEHIRYLVNHNNKMIIIVNYALNWSFNNESGNCLTKTFCEPANYTLYNLHVLDWINRSIDGNETLLNYIDFEIWNEPDGNFLLSSQTGSINQSLAYNRIYSNVKNAILTRYPQVSIIGPALGNYANWRMQTYFIANFTPSIYSIHDYTWGWTGSRNFTLAGDGLLNTLNTVTNNYSLYGVQPDRIVISEFNTLNSTIQNTTSLESYYGMQIATFYNTALNYNASKLSLIFYNFAEPNNYTSGNRYKMVASPQFENRYYPPYNITKLFANNHKALNYVVTSSIADSTVKIVASKDSNGQKYITLTNTNSTGAFDVTLSGMTTDFVDVQTGERYNLNDGSNTITINGLASYEVLTLRSTSTVGIGSTCDSTTITFYKIILDMAALAIIAVVLYLIFKDGWEDITIQKMLIAGIAIIVGVILFQQSAGNLGIGNCP